MRARSRILILASVLIGVGVPAEAQPQGDAIAGLQKGAYELRDLETGRTTQICLKQDRDLIQIRHPEQTCEHFVVKSDAGELGVHYSCKDHGWGLTKVRTEGNRLAQVDSQGMLDGRPFALRAELRFKGAC